MKNIAYKLNLVLLILVFSTCRKVEKKRVTIEGYYYNGSTGEILKNKKLYLWEISKFNPQQRGCSGQRNSLVTGKTSSDNNGHFCFNKETMYQSDCCFYIIDNQNTIPLDPGFTLVAYNVLKGITPSAKKQNKDFHKLILGGINFKIKSIILRQDSLFLKVKHIGHSRTTNLYGEEKDEYSISIGEFSELGYNPINPIGINIKADFFGMGQYEYTFFTKRKSDGVVSVKSGNAFANENEFVTIEI